MTNVDSNTFATESAGATDTMNVVFTISVGPVMSINTMYKTGHSRRKVVIDDQRHLLDIDTTSEQIGGNENTRRARTELLHQDLTLLLLHVTVLGIIALVSQLFPS